MAKKFPQVYGSAQSAWRDAVFSGILFVDDFLRMGG
jgi:hypothetical protein